MGVDLRQEVEQLMRAGTLALPTWPGVALKLQQLVSSNNYGISDLSKLVEADQALAAQALRTANSAYYRASSPVTTLPQAITRIGASELANLAIASTLGASSGKTGPLAPLRRASWRKSLVAAAFTQVLSRGRGLDPGEGFLAGLLCDFGETIAWGAFETIIARHADFPSRPLADWLADGEALRVELGMVLAAAWKLPPYVSEVVTRSPDGDVTGCAFPGLVSLVVTTSALTTRVLAAPSFTATKLDDLEGLRLDERVMLSRVLPGVPGLLQSYDDALPRVPTTASLVSDDPTSTLPLPVYLVDLPAAIRHRDREDAYQLVALSQGGARVHGGSPQPLHQLVTLDVDGHRYAALVRRCTSVGGRFQIEVQPFALDDVAQERWERLLTNAQRDATV